MVRLLEITYRKLQNMLRVYTGHFLNFRINLPTCQKSWEILLLIKGSGADHKLRNTTRRDKGLVLALHLVKIVSKIVLLARVREGSNLAKLPKP